MRNRGNLAFDAKGKVARAETRERNTEEEARGGAPRTSNEGSVMDLEQRGRVVQERFSGQPDRGGADESFQAF